MEAAFFINTGIAGGGVDLFNVTLKSLSWRVFGWEVPYTERLGKKMGKGIYFIGSREKLGNNQKYL